MMAFPSSLVLTGFVATSKQEWVRTAPNSLSPASSAPHP